MASLDFDLEESAFHAFYGQHRQLLEAALADYVAQLTSALERAGGIEVSKIEGRVKDKTECVRKFSRKYRTALEESNTAYTIAPYITDLIGVRVVCLYEDELDKVAQAVRAQFDVMEVTDKAAAVESTEASFGYKGLHLDLRPRLLPGAPPAPPGAQRYPFELQVRTIVQDAWAVLDHKIKYKKAIPGPLKRRINVLAALFELADREFRQIRDATEAELLQAPDETATAPSGEPEQPPENAPAPGSRLNAFTFLKIATHFFKDYTFEPHHVDSFVDDVHHWSPDITRARFNTLVRENIGTVKRYKQYLEEQKNGRKLNPYTVMRHSLYLGNNSVFSAALGKGARESFETWLSDNPT